MLKLWKDYGLQRKAKRMHSLNASATALFFPKCTALRWQLRSLCCGSHVCETNKDACHDCHGLGINVGHWSCQIHFQLEFCLKKEWPFSICQSFPARAPKTRIFPKFPATHSCSKPTNQAHLHWTELPRTKGVAEAQTMMPSLRYAQGWPFKPKKFGFW